MSIGETASGTTWTRSQAGFPGVLTASAQRTRYARTAHKRTLSLVRGLLIEVTGSRNSYASGVRVDKSYTKIHRAIMTPTSTSAEQMIMHERPAVAQSQGTLTGFLLVQKAKAWRWSQALIFAALRTSPKFSVQFCGVGAYHK